MNIPDFLKGKYFNFFNQNKRLKANYHNRRNATVNLVNIQTFQHYVFLMSFIMFEEYGHNDMQWWEIKEKHRNKKGNLYPEKTKEMNSKKGLITPKPLCYECTLRVLKLPLNGHETDERK